MHTGPTGSDGPGGALTRRLLLAAQAKPRESVYFKSTAFTEGKPTKSGAARAAPP